MMWSAKLGQVLNEHAGGGPLERVLAKSHGEEAGLAASITSMPLRTPSGVVISARS